MRLSPITIRLVRVAAAIFFAIGMTSCSWFQGLLQPPDKGLKGMETVAKTNPGTRVALESAREGARISFLEEKDYRRALFFYKYIVLYSEDEKERLAAQKHLAEIFFERLSDYEQAVVEFNRLLALPRTDKETTEYRMNIARSYFYLNRFGQADAELDLIIRSNPNEATFFDASLLRANIGLATRKVEGAIEIFKSLMEKFPDRAKEEHVGLSLAVCYEEKNDFKSARMVLNDIRKFYPRPDFIDLKIQRLQERETQLPGAQGLRK